jgi:hypothetical protein
VVSVWMAAQWEQMERMDTDCMCVALGSTKYACWDKARTLYIFLSVLARVESLSSASA